MWFGEIDFNDVFVIGCRCNALCILAMFIKFGFCKMGLLNLYVYGWDVALWIGCVL